MINKFFKILDFINISKIYLFFIILIAAILVLLEIFGLGFFQLIILQIFETKGETVNSFLLFLTNFIETNFSDNNISIIIFFFSFFFILKSFVSIVLNTIHFNFIKKVHQNLLFKNFNLLLKKNYLNFIKNNNIYYNQLFSRYSEYFVKNVLGSLIKITTDSFFVLCVLFYLFTIDPFLISKAVFFIFSFALIYIYLIKKFLKKNSERIGIAEENYKFTIYEYIKNFREIYLYNLKPKITEKFNQNSKSFTRYEKNYLILSNTGKYIFEILIIFFISLYLYQNIGDNFNEYQLSAAITLAFAVIKMMPYLNSLNHSISQLYQSYYSIKNIYDFISDKTLISNVTKKISKKNKIKKIEVTNIHFSFNNKTILKKTNLLLKRNNIYILKGKSGSGKTTFIDLLTGIIKPDYGKIKFIDNNNKFINNFNNFSYISQTPNLFYGTVKYNLTLGKKEINSKFISHIIQELELDNQGTLNENFIISEDGKNISGGQRQKISIARSLVQDRDVLLYDEVTSGLDTESEKKVINVIEKYSKNKIIIFISHKDKILFNKKSNILLLTNGKIKKI
tara:strand:- start:2014 stop:3708 length:1695 start_codon:yes stop_codon:yes gene_type:complete